MESPLQANSSRLRTVAVPLVLLLVGVVNLTYALAEGPRRPADALQGVGMLLLGAGAALANSDAARQRLAETGRAKLPAIVISFSVVACVLSVVMRAL